MLESLSGFFETFRKLAPLPLIALFIASSVLIFISDSFAETLGVEGFRSDYRGVIGGVLIASASYLFAHLVWWARSKAIAFFEVFKLRSRRARLVQTLTPDAKAYLVPLIDNQQACIYLEFDDGVGHDLVNKGILYRAGGMARLERGIPHLIHPWARDYLQSHPEVLQGIQPAGFARFDDD